MRLLIVPPEPDETITSVLDRAATLYGTTRGELVWELKRNWGSLEQDKLWTNADLDVDPPRSLIRALARALECSDDLIGDLRLASSKWLLDPASRRAYCEKCFDEDIARTGSVYLRHDWAFSFVTHCRRHKVPLSSLSYTFRRGVYAERELPIMQRLKRKQPYNPVRFASNNSSLVLYGASDESVLAFEEIWKRLCRFESRLLKSCFSSPHRFDQETAPYRDLVKVFSGNWDDLRCTPVMFYLFPVEAFIAPLAFHIPRTLEGPDHDVNDVWDTFLRKGDPMWRRGATWLLTQCFSDEDPIDLYPSYEQLIRKRVRILTINRKKWFEACLDELPDYGRQLARGYSSRWETPLCDAVEQLLTATPHLDVEKLNQRRIAKHLEQMSLIRASIGAADRAMLLCGTGAALDNTSNVS